MKKTTKIWVGIGAFVMAGGGMTQAPASVQSLALETAPSASAPLRHKMLSSTAPIVLAQNQGSEGGEGGEGGEAGIDVAATDKDPVEYNIALQVIAAHYYAGFAAYEAKETEAGAQMFAHGLGEVYIVMEDVFKRRGVTALGKDMEAAVDAAASNKPVAQVRKLVDAVLKDIEAAKRKGPATSLAPVSVKAHVIADMLNRAAAQYQSALGDKALEPYLDGLGFSIAARKEAETILPALKKADKKAGTAIEVALKLANTAYPGMRRKDSKADTGRFRAAASAAQLAVSGLR